MIWQLISVLWFCGEWLGALSRRSSDSSFYEGIDFLRASSVFLVLWSHGGPLLHEQQRSFLYSTFFRPGFWGVNIFFSISGFLIIGQLLDMASRAKLESLRVFVIRRFLRILPTYWLAMLIVLSLGLAPWPRSGVLIANLFLVFPFLQAPGLLPVTWTLVIEVWSYLLYAALAFGSRSRSVLSRLGRGWCPWLPPEADLLAISLLVLPLIASIHRYELAIHGSSVQSLKQGFWPQLDALAYGGILAWFKRARSLTLARLSGWRWLFPICLLLMALIVASAPALWANLQASFPSDAAIWMAFGFYPCVGLLSCLLIIGLLRFRYEFLPHWIAVALRALSRCSYSVYLIHLSLIPLVLHLIPGPGLVAFGSYLLSSIIVGHFGMQILERPFFRLRNSLLLPDEVVT